MIVNNIKVQVLYFFRNMRTKTIYFIYIIYINLACTDLLMNNTNDKLRDLIVNNSNVKYNKEFNI